MNIPNQWQNLEKPSAKIDKTNDNNIQCNSKYSILPQTMEISTDQDVT